MGITGYSGFVVRPRRRAETVSIGDCGVFDSRTVVLTFGQDLLVRNRASETFAPQLVEQAGSMRSAAPGATIRIRPRKAGRYSMIDGLGHDWMRADVFVANSSVHAVTDNRGHFRIEGVPIGNLRLSAMHPAIRGETSTQVEIRKDQTTTVDLTIVDEPRR